MGSFFPNGQSDICIDTGNCYFLMFNVVGSGMGCEEHEEVPAGQCVFTKYWIWVWWPCHQHLRHQEHKEVSKLWRESVLLWCGNYISFYFLIYFFCCMLGIFLLFILYFVLFCITNIQFLKTSLRNCIKIVDYQ